MRAIEVDPQPMVAVVQPGLLNAEVKAAAREHGLWYPPDPSSFEICSIGGNLATNAGGLCCVKYGVTTDYVLGIEVVLADGRALRLGGRTIKDVAGYDLKRLFIGSEGTLGIITEATLRLRPLRRRHDDRRHVRRRGRRGPRRDRGGHERPGPRRSSSWTPPRSPRSKRCGRWASTPASARCCSPRSTPAP